MNIYESINAIMQEVPAIGKDQVNKQQGFKFRGIDAVMNTLQPLLAKHKVFVVPQVLEQTREERQTSKGGTLLYSILKIKYTFYAEDGTFVEAITTGEGMDSGDKASNKAMAIAMKYAMFQVFCIPTEDDPDAETPPEIVGKKDNKKQPQPQTRKITREELDTLLKLFLDKGITDEVVQQTLDLYQIKDLSELNDVQHGQILRKLKGEQANGTTNENSTDSVENTEGK